MVYLQQPVDNSLWDLEELNSFSVNFTLSIGNQDLLDGNCEQTSPHHCECIGELASVCGCNGVTYRNITCAICDGLKSWAPGDCAN